MPAAQTTRSTRLFNRVGTESLAEIGYRGFLLEIPSRPEVSPPWSVGFLALSSSGFFLGGTFLVGGGCFFLADSSSSVLSLSFFRGDSAAAGWWTSAGGSSPADFFLAGAGFFLGSSAASLGVSLALGAAFSWPASFLTPPSSFGSSAPVVLPCLCPPALASEATFLALVSPEPSGPAAVASWTARFGARRKG